MFLTEKMIMILKALLTFFLLLNVSCVFVDSKTDVYIELNAQDSGSGSNGSSLNFTMAYLDILAGDTQVITASNGSGTYSMTANSYGVFAPGTSSYTANTSIAPGTHVLAIQDSINILTGNLNVNVFGLQEQFLMDQIKTFGDQNYPKSVAQTNDGSIYVGTVFIDGSGWEDWGVFKSTDNGLNWTQVDKYLPYLYGEAHTMEIATKNNDIYVCGYIWGYSATPGFANSEWLVRKSSDGGATWQNVDHYYPNPSDNVCYAMTVAPNGDIVAVGYSYNASTIAHIRLSSDDGATWQTIGTINANHTATAVRVSPDGKIWVAIDNNLYKAEYIASSWNWTGPFQIAPSALSYVGYSQKGEIEIVDNNVAYFIGGRGTNWEIYKTTNGGTSWSLVHSRPGEGTSLRVLSTGEIVATGHRQVSYSEIYLEIIKSTDAGTSWSLVHTSGVAGYQGKEEGVKVLELLNNEVLLLGFRYLDNQVKVFKSTDAGDNWGVSSIITYYDHLYANVEDYAEDSLGNLFTTGWLYNVEPSNPQEPYAVMKSSDNGTSWSVADYNYQVGVDHSSSEVEVNNIDTVFAVDQYTGNNDLRMSLDNGVNWSVIDTTNAGNFSNLTTDTSGNLFYVNNPELKKASPTGASVSVVYTFPIDGSHTSFSTRVLKGTPDGQLYLLASANVSAVATKLLYRSNDQGVSWTLLYSAASSSFNAGFNQASNGDLYIYHDTKIFRSTDSGSSWSTIYDTNFAGNITSIVTSNDNKVFIVINDVIYSLNEDNSTWFKFWDIDIALSPIIGSEINFLFNCRFSPIGVCAVVVDYTKYDGSANYLWAIKGP